MQLSFFQAVGEVFGRKTPVKTLEQELDYENRRKALEHRAAAEYHGALAQMYEGRVERAAVQTVPSIDRPLEIPLHQNTAVRNFHGRG